MLILYDENNNYIPNENLTFTREELVKWLWKIIHNNAEEHLEKIWRGEEC